MEFFKKLFKDDDYIVGLSGFKNECEDLKISRKKSSQSYYNIFTPQKQNLVFYTNTKNNFLLS